MERLAMAFRKIRPVPDRTFEFAMKFDVSFPKERRAAA
jgi:hypothetical protein